MSKTRLAMPKTVQRKEDGSAMLGFKEGAKTPSDPISYMTPASVIFLLVQAYSAFEAIFRRD
ncbi:hypothetical protein [Thalassovita sp.]|uniref:hypothetical protein n=1 Tax=Thalassovita sp. TaxID=1979401 RepID=UPI003B5AAB55